VNTKRAPPPRFAAEGCPLDLGYVNATYTSGMTDSGVHIVRRKDRGARQRILVAAEDLFQNQGIHVTGMEELAEAANVSKRTLYKYFPKKEDLVLQYLRAHEADDKKELGALNLSGLPPRERLLAIFDAIQPSPGSTEIPRGCVFLNAAVEMPDPDHPVHVLVREHKELFAKRLAEVSAEAGAADPEQLGDDLALLYDGAASRSVALASNSAAIVARRMAETLVDAQIPAA
jgi:AcrR family transcriptional regulator